MFFEECKSGVWKTRTILLDSDSGEIDYARTGELGKIYGVDNFCYGNTSMSSIFALGRSTGTNDLP